MKKGQIIFFSILILLTLSLILLIYSIDLRFDKQQANFSQTAPSQKDLKETYEKKLTAIFEKYANEDYTNDPDAIKRTENIKKMQDEIIALIVPGEYKDLHLNLIIAFNKYLSADPLDRQMGKEILTSEANHYSWLALTLSIFILNYQ
jgi:hypothetical protein